MHRTNTQGIQKPGPGRALLRMAVISTIFLLTTAGGASAADIWTDLSDTVWQERYAVRPQDARTVDPGYPDGSFRPDESVSREQFDTMLGRGLGLPRPDAARPDSKVVRQQALAILGLWGSEAEIAALGGIQGNSRMYPSLAEWFGAEGSAILGLFADGGDVDPANRQAAAFLAARGAAAASLKGTTGTSLASIPRLLPSSELTRADAVSMILRTKAAADPRFGFMYPDPADFSTLSWTGAFTAMHGKFSREYAFGDWKSVDWSGLYRRYLPRIEGAQATGDEEAWYLALHEYICSIPDGHISLSATDRTLPAAIAKRLAGGGYGLAAAELDDGKVIAAVIVPDGPAARAGILAGAEIVAWGGLPAGMAIGQIEVGAIPFKILTGAFGNENPKATQAGHRMEQLRLLARGPIGSNVDAVIRNPGASDNRMVTLATIDDWGASFRLLDFAPRPAFTNQVDYRILPEGCGYVLVRMEYDPESGGYPARVYNQFRDAIASFAAAGVSGVIVDLRGNYGGSDQLAADICGFFYSSPAFYEKQEYFDKRTGRFLKLTLAESGSEPIVDQLSILPQTPHYGGPLAILVNLTTTSSGEGVAMGLSRLSNAAVIGFHGTNGSFGMVGGEILLPGGYAIGYPFGRSVDRDGVVQLDSRNGVGGITPKLHVPMTLENVLAYAAGTDVELQYAIEYMMGR